MKTRVRFPHGAPFNFFKGLGLWASAPFFWRLEMKVSIIMAVFNYPGLTKALDSIPRRNDIEVLVVDDCSTDET